MGIWCGWDHLETSIIFELIDMSEFNNLLDYQKGYIKLLLSCSRVNFREGTQARIIFLECFPEGTITYGNLVALFTLHEPLEE